MLNIRKIFATAAGAILSGLLLSGCIKESVTPAADLGTVKALLSIDTRADGSQQPTSEELTLTSLRVYAFVDGMFAGHYYKAGGLSSPSSFLMDLKMFSTVSQYVDFYIVANESSMGGLNVDGSDFSFSPETTEDQLMKVRFSSLDTGFGTGQVNGLPMFYQDRIEVNVAEKDPDGLPDGTVVNAGDHQGHVLIAQKIKFSLKRPFAKLGVFAAGVDGQPREATVTSVLLYNDATANYLMPQTSLSPSVSVSGRSLYSGSLLLDKKLSPAASASVRKDESNYNEIALPVYLFENPWGSTDWNVQDADSKGCRLRLSYSIGGVDAEGDVYLPVIKRNNYYKILCLINDRVEVSGYEVIVEPWTEIELDVPSFN